MWAWIGGMAALVTAATLLIGTAGITAGARRWRPCWPRWSDLIALLRLG
jgi:hypothetical protein